MTDTITPASLRAHADWIDGCGHGLGPGEALRAEAARLEAESARDEEVETLAKVMSAAMDPGSEWSLWPAGVVERWKTAARAVLDQLAADGRLLPEGGVVTWPEFFAKNQPAPPAVSVPDSGPDGTPEKPWPTWQDVPEGVAYRGARDRSGWEGWINQDGVRCRVFDRAPSKNADSTLADEAPFVRVDGDKA